MVAKPAGWTRSTDLLDLTGKLGEKLRALRETRGISLKEASDITGVPRPTLSRIEHNKMAPTIGLLSKIVAGFGVPALWVRMKPENPQRPISWSRFMSEGIETLSGRLDAKSATVQVLILPTLIFLWGIATVTIAAIVRG